MRVIVNGKGRLCCDATDPREGRGWGKPCARRVVAEQWVEMPDPCSSYPMHYCARHRGRSAERPRCAVRATVRDLGPAES